MTDNLPTGVAFDDSGRLFPSTSSGRTGEAAAFEQVMVCTQHNVAATAWRLLGNREDARDAAQEVFLRAFKYLKAYRPEQDFHGWLYRITVNVCRDMLRGRGGPGAHQPWTDDAGQFALEPGRRVRHERRRLAQQPPSRRAVETLPRRSARAGLRDSKGFDGEGRACGGRARTRFGSS